VLLAWIGLTLQGIEEQMPDVQPSDVRGQLQSISEDVADLRRQLAPRRPTAAPAPADPNTPNEYDKLIQEKRQQKR
jgi:hypothetical protein